MSNLQHRQTKIQAKRKTTEWRDFVMEICSWFPVNISKIWPMVSRYPNRDRIKNILTQKEYENIGNQSNSEDYDFKVNFWSNYVNLRDKTFFWATTNQWINENADYAIWCFGVKDAYLSCVVGDNAEKVLYSSICYSNVWSILNSVKIMNNSYNIYDSFFVTNSYLIFYSKYIFNSSEVRFSSNLINCSECIFCDNLENASYHISNQKYSKDEYFLSKQKIIKDKQLFYDLRMLN